VVNEAEVEIAAGERVLVSGASGTGKSTLVRAIAGLWPWGSGEIVIRFEGLTLMPQRVYLPLGTLRRALTYPLSPETVDDAIVRKMAEDVGLGQFLDRLDEDADWENILSGGEKQRLAFARLLIQRPNVIVMDEATSALDPLSQDEMMKLVIERLPTRRSSASGTAPSSRPFTPASSSWSIIRRARAWYRMARRCGPSAARRASWQGC
jgi:putative ATP-binding cassette transporter